MRKIRAYECKVSKRVALEIYSVVRVPYKTDELGVVKSLTPFSSKFKKNDQRYKKSGLVKLVFCVRVEEIFFSSTSKIRSEQALSRRIICKRELDLGAHYGYWVARSKKNAKY